MVIRDCIPAPRPLIPLPPPPVLSSPQTNVTCSVRPSVRPSVSHSLALLSPYAIVACSSRRLKMLFLAIYCDVCRDRRTGTTPQMHDEKDIEGRTDIRPSQRKHRQPRGTPQVQRAYYPSEERSASGSGRIGSHSPRGSITWWLRAKGIAGPLGTGPGRRRLRTTSGEAAALAQRLLSSQRRPQRKAGAAP